jgi:hypothetical protein
MGLKKKNVVMHLGLPKTATTALQGGFFPRYSTFAGKPSLSDPSRAAVIQNPHSYARLIKAYHQFSGLLPPSVNGWQDDLSRWADELVFDESGLLIFSGEWFSAWARGQGVAWPVEYEYPLPKGTHPITLFLSELRLLLPQEINLTTIVTLRNQSDFLGSLAAQMKRERYFDSSSFDQLVTHGDAFLDFNQFVRDLENVSGAQNHLTLLFEDGLQTNMSKIVDLIGPPDLDTEFDPGGEIPAVRVRRSGSNSWAFRKTRLPIVRKIDDSVASRALRRSKWWPLFRPLFRPLFDLLVKIQKASKIPMTMEISDADRLRIRSICHTSNEFLAAHLKRDLVDLGY